MTAPVVYTGGKRLFVTLIPTWSQIYPRLARRSYNVGVAAPVSSKPVADDKAAHRHRHTIYAEEASGLLIIAILLLILCLIRYWPYIRWSAR